MRRWLFLFIAIFSLACLTQGLATAIPLEKPGIESAATPFSLPDCQPSASVTFKVQKINDTLVMLIASGLQPGETPFVYYSTEKRMGGYDGNIVSDKTEFYSELDLEDRDVTKQATSGEQLTTTWDIRLEHRGGVECTTITLP